MKHMFCKSYLAGESTPALLFLLVLQVVFPLLPSWGLSHFQEVVHLVHNRLHSVPAALKLNISPARLGQVDQARGTGQLGVYAPSTPVRTACGRWPTAGRRI